MHCSFLSSFAGGNVDVSHVMGKGFPMDKAPHETIKELLIFATGSGISPIRSLIESGIIQVSPISGPVEDGIQLQQKHRTYLFYNAAQMAGGFCRSFLAVAVESPLYTMKGCYKTCMTRQVV